MSAVMAKPKTDAVPDNDAEPAPAAKPAAAEAKKGGAMPLLAAVVISTAASAGISWFLSQQSQAAMLAAMTKGGEGAEAGATEAAAGHDTSKAPPLYQTMEPSFVVNLDEADHARFLQVQVEVMARESEALEAVGRYNPRIRNALLMLFSQQHVAELGSREGKEKLQASVLAEIQNVLRDETGHPGVEAVYFTSFVMQ